MTAAQRPLDGAGNRRTRLLVILNKAPYPDSSGSRRRNLRLLEAGAKVFDVDVLIVGARLTYSEREELSRLPACQVEVVEASRSSRSLLGITRWALGKGPPLGWLTYELPATQREVAAAIRKLRPDVAWSSNSTVASLLLPVLDFPLAVDAAHIERESIDSQLRAYWPAALTDRVMFERAVRVAIDRSAVVRNDEAGFRRADLVTATSVREARASSRGVGVETVLVPNGVDLPEVANRTVGGGRLLLVGNFAYEPNRAAAEILVKKVLPLVQQQHRHATVELVGSSPDRIRGLESRAVSVSGFVEDLSSVYARAELVVVPVSFGSGPKSKMLEAFAYGVPAITTPAGNAGIDVEDGRHLLVASTPTELADLVSRLLADPGEADSLAAEARAWVASEHTWSAIGERFCEAMHELARGGWSSSSQAVGGLD